MLSKPSAGTGGSDGHGCSVDSEHCPLDNTGLGAEDHSVADVELVGGSACELLPVSVHAVLDHVEVVLVVNLGDSDEKVGKVEVHCFVFQRPMARRAEDSQPRLRRWQG